MLAGGILFNGLEYTVWEGDAAIHLDLRATIFDRVPQLQPNQTFLMVLRRALAASPLSRLSSEREFLPPQSTMTTPAGQTLRVWNLSASDFGRALTRARRLDVNAIAIVNRLRPGHIYEIDTIRDEITRQTRIAIVGPRAERSRARRWLRKACIPSGQVPRGLKRRLGQSDLALLDRVYFDTVKIRTVSRILQSRTGPTIERDKLVPEVQKLFPHADLKPLDWMNLCGVFKEDRRDSEAPRPLVMAARLLARDLGYEERFVRQQMAIALPHWRRQQKQIATLARQTARDLVSPTKRTP